VEQGSGALREWGGPSGSAHAPVTPQRENHGFPLRGAARKTNEGKSKICLRNLLSFVILAYARIHLDVERRYELSGLSSAL
jgi:hypothetical protein